MTTCHSYEIAFKFHYTCRTCGYIYGRHSRSIDTESTRCGRCSMGKLELSAPLRHGAPAGDAGAEVKRAPSAYQLFTAENRAAVTAALPHGTAPKDIMRALAARWTAHKAATAAEGGRGDGGGHDEHGLATSLARALVLDD